MLKITRKVGQEICLFDENDELLFTISVEGMKQGQVSIGITNDQRRTSVKRKETLEKKNASNNQASSDYS